MNPSSIRVRLAHSSESYDHNPTTSAHPTQHFFQTPYQDGREPSNLKHTQREESLVSLTLTIARRGLYIEQGENQIPAVSSFLQLSLPFIAPFEFRGACNYWFL